MSAWALEGITHSFGGSGWLSAALPHTAVRDVSLEIQPGERVGLIGESGSGKTTLARLGLGLLRPDAGTVRLFGEDTASWSRRRWLAARHRAQLLFQSPRAMINPAMPLGWVLTESAALHRPGEDARAAAKQALAEVGLASREHAHAHELSGGELRRAGIARVLLARPELVVADEPTAGLDAALKAELIELLLERVGPQCAVVLISHDLPLVLWSCSRVLVMQGGSVVDRFETSTIGESERHPHTTDLLRAAGMTDYSPTHQTDA